MAPQTTFSRKEIEGKPGMVILNGRAMDVSGFAKFHPGGEKLLLDESGRDITKLFYSLHRHEVFEKYESRLTKGLVEGHNAKSDPENWTDASRVPFAEVAAMQGFKGAGTYTEQDHKFRLVVRKWLQDSGVKEWADRAEETEKAPGADIFKKIGESGFLALNLGPGDHLDKLIPMLPKGHLLDQAGMTTKDFTYFSESVVHEETCRLMTPGAEDGMLAGFTIGASVLVRYGSEWMQRDVLPKVVRGEEVICLAITEPFVGSDVANLKTTATKTADGRHYVVNGSKKWITCGHHAQWFVTAVRTGGPGAGGISFLLCERPKDDKHGVLDTQIIKTDYSSAAGTALVTFENLLVPVENLIGVENQGFPLILANFNHERWAICSGVIARARLIVSECERWSMQRVVFGKPLIAQPVIQQQFAEMIYELECAHAYFEKITHQMNVMSYAEQNRYLSGPISLLKVKSTRMGQLVQKHAYQIFGGRGGTRGGMGKNVERFGRSLVLPSVYGGAEGVMASLGVKLSVMKAYPKNARL